MLSNAPAMAIALYEPSGGEKLMMPVNCQRKLKGYNPTETAWAQHLGAETWAHRHNYCHGLKLVHRATLTTDKAERRQYLSDEIGEFNYVLGYWAANSPAIPDAKAKKAKVELMQKQQ